MLKQSLIALAIAAAPLAAAQAQRGAPDFAAAVSAPGRPEAAVALDAVRRPAEVLRWAGPAGAATGCSITSRATAIIPRSWPARSGRPARSPAGTRPSSPARPQVRDALAAIRQRSPNTAFFSSPTTALSFPDSAYDFVMLHLVYHDAYWESAQFSLPRIDPNTVTAALFRATRPGGIVAVIDHVAAPGRETRAEVEATHRILPETIRADFERAGFVFDGESEMLANPQDDRSVNVFKPSIRGRTDRFVYRFRRPAR